MDFRPIPRTPLLFGSSGIPCPYLGILRTQKYCWSHNSRCDSAARSPPDLIYLVDRTNNPASIVGSKSCMNKQISHRFNNIISHSAYVTSVCVLKCTGVAPSTLLLTIDYAVMQIVSVLSAPCIPSNSHSKHHSYSGHAGWSSSSSRSISRSAQTCASALLKKSFLLQIIGST